MTLRAALALLMLLGLSTCAHAQLAVSSNDTKVVNVDGVNQIVQNPPPDNVTIVDLGVSPPKVVGQLNAPGSVVGPPQSVAIAPDESIALVAASTKIDPSDPKKTAPDNRLSVIDLKASPPAVIAAADAEARKKIGASVMEQLQRYADGDGVTYPEETHVVTAVC